LLFCRHNNAWGIRVNCGNGVCAFKLFYSGFKSVFKNFCFKQFFYKVGKVSVGKSCIRIKKLEDINLPILKQVLKQAEKSPGLVDLKK
jgi:hypothetical protein